ncbi:MAG: helix-turn-helix transcriptional regulator [Clostridia bacterium]|nr:helix-turn-helix transcriptional regulator [Clostridia bacterium]
MEFNEKLQKLRKDKGLTQEELAQILYVSRTAISKWESGRGYPSIESLKAIAKFFSVTIDELLSGEEIITIAEEDNKNRETDLRSLVYSMLDLSVALLFFLPFFGQGSTGMIEEVSLLGLTDCQLWLKMVYYIIVTAMIAAGCLNIICRRWGNKIWSAKIERISLAVTVAGTLLFIMSRQPYAAAFLFIFLIIKVFMLIKTQ